jgi:hypothetical protein
MRVDTGSRAQSCAAAHRVPNAGASWQGLLVRSHIVTRHISLAHGDAAPPALAARCPFACSKMKDTRKSIHPHKHT